MGFRFRRSLKIAPGLRLNFGKRGVSMSAGPRGATVNIGRRGTHVTTSVPGTGLSYSQKLPASSEAVAPAMSNQIPAATAIALIVMALGFFAMLTEDRALRRRVPAPQLANGRRTSCRTAVRPTIEAIDGPAPPVIAMPSSDGNRLNLKEASSSDSASLPSEPNCTDISVWTSAFVILERRALSNKSRSSGEP